jgi:hypothetical protein
MTIYSPNFEKHEFFKENAQYIPRLPEFEQILIECFLNHMGQKETALTLGCTQGAVSNRLRRAIRRISFLKRLDKFDLSNLDQILKPVYEGPEDAEIIKGMIQTTSQSQTALLVNGKLKLTGSKKMTQVKVRHRYMKCLEKLKWFKEIDPKRYEQYVVLLEFVKNNLYTLSEVKLPQYKRG